MPTISKINGIAIGSISKINGIAKASIAKVDGISISVPAWVSPTAIHSKCGESEVKPASNTIDGDTGTYWVHVTSHEHWIIFDLGESKTVKKVRLYVLSRSDADDTICEVSAVYINDSADESGGSKGSLVLPASGTQWYEIDVTDTSGRYIKLKLKTYYYSVCGTSAGVRYFYEFEAYV